MKRIAILFLLLANVSLSAQSDTLTYADLEKEIESLKSSIRSLQYSDGMFRNDLKSLSNLLSEASDTIDFLRSHIESTSKAIDQTTAQLDSKISSTAATASQQIRDIDSSLSKKSLWGIIGLLTAMLVSGIIYFLLNKKQKTDKSDLIEQLEKNKNTIEENLIKEFEKQTDLMGVLIKEIEEQRKAANQSPTNSEVDHSLALKVADEITLIERNISLMDKKVRGLKQLSRSVQKLRDNLNANGYNLPELLGRPFHQGMKLVVINTLPDDTLEEGAEIITKIIKPQVNYDEKMIQAAQVEISVG